jgi:hypothetical protein
VSGGRVQVHPPVPALVGEERRMGRGISAGSEGVVVPIRVGTAMPEAARRGAGAAAAAAAAERVWGWGGLHVDGGVEDAGPLVGVEGGVVVVADPAHRAQVVAHHEGHGRAEGIEHGLAARGD